MAINVDNKNMTVGQGKILKEFLQSADKYLDLTKTSIVENFAWSDTTYPGSTDPSLEGKSVLVLALKDKDETHYSFASLSPIINDKADKVVEASRKADQLLVDDGNGNLKASGKTIAEVFAEYTATDDEFKTALGITTTP